MTHKKRNPQGVPFLNLLLHLHRSVSDWRPCTGILAGSSKADSIWYSVIKRYLASCLAHPCAYSTFASLLLMTSFSEILILACSSLSFHPCIPEFSSLSFHPCIPEFPSLSFHPCVPESPSLSFHPCIPVLASKPTEAIPDSACPYYSDRIALFGLKSILKHVSSSDSLPPPHCL